MPRVLDIVSQEAAAAYASQLQPGVTLQVCAWRRSAVKRPPQLVLALSRT
jgi:hypothetical protein